MRGGDTLASKEGRRLEELLIAKVAINIGLISLSLSYLSHSLILNQIGQMDSEMSFHFKKMQVEK